MSSEDNRSEDNPSESSKATELWTSLKTCPPIPPLSSMTSMVFIALLFYGTLWGLTGDDALPGGHIFGLFGLALVCYLGGQFTKLLRMPTLVGMMVFGFILRNVQQINIAKDIPDAWGGNIRHMALILILLRAGLEVDSHVLRSNKATCSKLIFIPFIAEFVSASVAAKYLLNMPWIWGFLMGAMLSAVSPAVVLPVMLKLQKKGIGTGNGVPTMVIAVAGIDDVLALTAFEVLLGVAFATGSMGWTIAQGPLEMIVGILYGIILGVIFWYIPNPDEKKKSLFRFLLLLFGGMFCIYGSQEIKWGAAGALGCICLPFVAALSWKQKDWDDEESPVPDALAFIWKIIEPFLFGMIGAEIRIEYLQPSTVGLGLATMFIALAFRMMASMLAAYTAGLSLKEQIFVTFAGLPKATVQAAIGPMALSMAREKQLGPDIIEYGIEILTVAVLAILIFAPLGAVAIQLLAPRLLGASSSSDPEEKSKENVPETVIPMYEQNSSYTSYGTKDDENNHNHTPNSSEENNQYRSYNLSSENIRNKASNLSEENSSNVYTIEKL